MAASINDLITAVMNGGAPVPTTVSSIRTPGATTLSVVALTHWPVVTAVHFVTGTPTTDALGQPIINPTSLALWKAIVSGTTLVNLTLEASATGSDPGNSVNDIVQMAPDSAWAQDLYTALTAEHDTTGKHLQAMTINGVNVWNILTQEWVSALETWTFASSTTITVPSNATLKYQVGDLLQLTQSATVKYFVVTAVAATVLTVTPLLGTTLANATISANSYAHATPFAAPAGIAYSPYKFSVQRHAAQTSSNAYIVVPFDTKIFDTGNNFDVVTNHNFVAPVAGYYFFTGMAGNTVAGATAIFASLFQNGAKVHTGNGAGGAANGTYASVSGLLKCAAGDTVDLRFIGGNGSAMGVDADCYLDGFLWSLA